MFKKLFKTLIINALRLKRRIITPEATFIKQKTFGKLSNFPKVLSG
jgi:hypothetical protein